MTVWNKASAEREAINTIKIKTLFAPKCRVEYLKMPTKVIRTKGIPNANESSMIEFQTE